MRKTCAAFLLIIFTLATNGGWIINLMNHARMRERIAELRNRPADLDQLEKIIVSDVTFSTLQFEDDGQELEYHGEMYDIVKIVSVAGKRIIYCLHDGKETSLNYAGKSAPHKLLHYKLMISQMMSGPVKLLSLSFRSSSTAVTWLIYDGSLPSIHLDISTPPPDSATC